MKYPWSLTFAEDYELKKNFANWGEKIAKKFPPRQITETVLAGKQRYKL